ncbi:MAG TPA: porin family protein [Gemmatimonadales bacterium]|nr:porin family protein [Gemmatimonadales bacterium]
MSCLLMGRGRTLLLVTLGLGLAGPLWAQASLGVNLGYSRSSFVGSDSKGVSAREGAVAGAYFRLPLTSWLSVQPELQLASKGGASRVTAGNPPVPLRLELDLVYLDLPVLLRAGVPVPGGTRLVLLAGATPGVRIGCNVEFFQNGVSIQRNTCGAVNLATIRDWDVAVVGGAGLAVPIERSELALEVRYSRGFHSVSDLGDIRNSAISFTLAIPF